MRVADLASGPYAPTWAGEIVLPYGRNPLGETTFRVVWSGRRVSVIGGYFERNGLFGYRILPRYSGAHGWMLERWIPARHYGTPESWAASTVTPDGRLACGPYPVEGLYECCFRFNDVPLRPDTLAGLLRAIFCGRIRTISDIRRDLEAMERTEEAALDKEFDEQWDRTHGVRRGLSIGSSGTLVNYSEEIEKHKERLVNSKIRVSRDTFRPGFVQGELSHGKERTD